MVCFLSFIVRGDFIVLKFVRETWNQLPCNFNLESTQLFKKSNVKKLKVVCFWVWAVCWTILVCVFCTFTWNSICAISPLFFLMTFTFYLYINFYVVIKEYVSRKASSEKVASRPVLLSIFFFTTNVLHNSRSEFRNAK